MRRLAVLIWCLLATTNTAMGQTDVIGVYADVAGTDCDIVDSSGNFLTVYVVHTSVAGATASSFSAPAPECFSGSWLSDTSVFPITVGNSQDGVEMNYGSCQTGSFHILTINYYAPGVTPDCCPYTVLSHDGTLPPIVEVADCGVNTVAGVGETSQINKTAACDCCLPGTIYVPPFPNIQAAIDAACSGDTIVLADGTFIGPGNRDLIISTKSLTLKSASGNPYNCVIAPQGNEIDEHFGMIIELSDGGTTVIEGIGIEKSHHTIEGAIVSSGTVHNRISLVLRNCRINQNNTGVMAFFSDLEVENCLFEENVDFGLEVGFQSNAVIDGCEFRYNNGVGVEISNAEKAVVRNSTIVDNSGTGIHANPADSVIVRNTEITGNGNHGVDLSQTFGLIDSCTISNNASLGVMGSTLVVEIYNTVIANHTQGAVGIAFVSSGLISGSTLYGNSGRILQCTLGTDAGFDIDNTIIASNPATTTVYACNIYSVSCSDIWGNAGGDWVGNLAPFEGDFGNISNDPLFCDPDNGDYTLAALSDCLPAYNTCGVLIGALDQGCGEPTGVDDFTQPQISELSLYQNHPNPFNPSTAISFTLPRREQTNLSIYDIEGKMVTTLVDGQLDAGLNEVIWHGKDARGNLVSTGVYFYRLTAGEKTMTKKMVLLK